MASKNVGTLRAKFEQSKPAQPTPTPTPPPQNNARRGTNATQQPAVVSPAPAPKPVVVTPANNQNNRGSTTNTQSSAPKSTVQSEKEKSAKRITVFIEDENQLRTQARPPKPKPDTNRMSVMYGQVQQPAEKKEPPKPEPPKPEPPKPTPQPTPPPQQQTTPPVSPVKATPAPQSTPPPKQQPSPSSSSQPVQPTSSKEGFVIHEQWKIHYEELEFDELISEGSAGEVYLGYYFGTPVAIKKLFAVGPDQQHLVEREYSMLKDLNHPNIIQFLGICTHETGVYLITEYIENGDLFDLLVFNSESIYDKWKTKIKIALQVAQGVFYLHNRNVIHRDLKSQNILVGENHKVKLCDLGLATIIENKKRMTVCGTDEWMAPEIAIADSYDNKVDVFSFGVILTELITCNPPPKRTVQTFFAFDEKAFKNSIPFGCPEDLTQLVFECTNFEPTKRPSFKDIVAKLRKLHQSLPDDE